MISGKFYGRTHRKRFKPDLWLSRKLSLMIMVLHKHFRSRSETRMTNMGISINLNIVAK